MSDTEDNKTQVRQLALLLIGGANLVKVKRSAIEQKIDYEDGILEAMTDALSESDITQGREFNSDAILYGKYEDVYNLLKPLDIIEKVEKVFSIYDELERKAI